MIFQKRGSFIDKNKKKQKNSIWQLIFFSQGITLTTFRHNVCRAQMKNKKSPDSSEVEHLHGKQAVVGSIPISGRKK